MSEVRDEMLADEPEVPTDPPKALFPPLDDRPRFRNGKLIPKGFKPWAKGVSGNPGGRKKDYTGPSLAYQRCSQLSLKETERLAKGHFPVDWTYGRQVIYVTKARELLNAHTKASPSEINLRLEGAPVQRIDITGDGSPWAILASLAPPAAAQLVRDDAIETPALPAPVEK